VAVEGVRVHVPVADRGQSFYAEEKGLVKRTGRYLGDAPATKQIQAGEDKIDQDVNGQNQAANRGQVKVSMK
jgi:hypothetical protein